MNTKTKKLVTITVGLLAASIYSVIAAQGSKSTKAVAPRAVVVSLYKQHKTRSPFFQTRSRALLDKYFVKELADLLWKDARSSRGEVGALDGDPLYNAQDMEIKNFLVHEGTVGATTAEVPVSFTNFGEKKQIVFHLTREAHIWKIADIAYDDGTTLAGILKHG